MKWINICKLKVIEGLKIKDVHLFTTLLTK